MPTLPLLSPAGLARPRMPGPGWARPVALAGGVVLGHLLCLDLLAPARLPLGDHGRGTAARIELRAVQGPAMAVARAAPLPPGLSPPTVLQPIVHLPDPAAHAAPARPAADANGPVEGRRLEAPPPGAAMRSESVRADRARRPSPASVGREPVALAAASAAALLHTVTPSAPPIRVGENTPVQLPPAGELQFEVWRGGLPARTDAPPAAAEAVTLRWQIADGAYVLEWLQHGAAGRDVPAGARRAISRGRIGPAGLMPERFDDERLAGGRKAWRVVHFRQDEGMLSYSGSTSTHPLQAGTQDGASWLIQLIGIVAARPAWRSGDTVELQVAGLRGELDPWRFEVQPQADATDDADAARGAPTHAGAHAPDSQDGLTLRRPAPRPFEPAIEITLARAAPHWPQRIKFIQAAGRSVEWRRAAQSGTAAVALTGPVPQVGE